tara:strand:- start:64 stop:951 length:888 start_codon:yes stop_codon:yes gene_type:complete
MSFKQNNPLSRKTSPINKNWIKGAIKRPGAFKKKAEEAGMSTKAFAEKVTSNKDNYDARTGKQAELAETLMGMSRDSFTMEELNKDSKKQKAESKKQADELPQIEFPGSDYEMDQDMSYPGGERGRDYDEDGLKDLKKNGMSRHTSEHSTEEYMERKDAAIKEAKGVSRVASPLNIDDMEDMDDGEEVKSKKAGNSRAEIKARKSKEKNEGVSGSKRRANKAKSKSEAAAEKAKTAKNPDYKKQLEAKSERLAKRSKRKEKRSERKTRNKETRKANKESRESQRSPLEKNCKYKK